jgi:hypothetical protein
LYQSQVLSPKFLVKKWAAICIHYDCSLVIQMWWL